MTDKKRGRPKLSKAEPTVTRSITITESQLAFLEVYGFGNVSRGVRRLVDEKKGISEN